MVYSGVHEAEDSFLNNKMKYKPPTITKLLFEREGIIVSRQGIARVLKIYKETGTIDRCRGVTVRLQRTASCQQISTPPLKTGPMWINASTRWDACTFSTLSQRSASGVITSFYRCSTAVLPVFFKRSHCVAAIKRYGMEGFLTRTVV